MLMISLSSSLTKPPPGADSEVERLKKDLEQARKRIQELEKEKKRIEREF